MATIGPRSVSSFTLKRLYQQIYPKFTKRTIPITIVFYFSGKHIAITSDKITIFYFSYLSLMWMTSGHMVYFLLLQLRLPNFWPPPGPSVPIKARGCELESLSDEVYSIQHYVIKFASDFQQVGGFLQVLRFHPPIKLTVTI